MVSHSPQLEIEASSRLHMEPDLIPAKLDSADRHLLLNARTHSADQAPAVVCQNEHGGTAFRLAIGRADVEGTEPSSGETRANSRIALLRGQGQYGEHGPKDANQMGLHRHARDIRSALCRGSVGQEGATLARAGPVPIHLLLLNGPDCPNRLR